MKFTDIKRFLLHSICTVYLTVYEKKQCCSTTCIELGENEACRLIIKFFLMKIVNIPVSALTISLNWSSLFLFVIKIKQHIHQKMCCLPIIKWIKWHFQCDRKTIIFHDIWHFKAGMKERIEFKWIEIFVVAFKSKWIKISKISDNCQR